MRSLMILLVLVIFCSLQMTSSAPLAADVPNCCMEFIDVKIPVRQVKSYSWTSSNCPRRAIVFHMISGKEFCVDPETTWVNGHVAKVDKRKTSATTTTTTTTTTATTAKTQSPTV
ncbi:C-C motif chemokine 2 [Anabarilius grahami]|uniref:C-C motif chemokine 2 n=1 Tax=Anabarilius grahami TaxID=495550 RepID=A0A3N0Z810_ANAGA|nr:C-C motif chemokine 2 [Anabarilius grahami]